MPQPLDPVGRFTSRRELGTLTSLLQDGEELLAAVDGNLDGKVGLLGATGTRLLWVPAKGKSKSWPYEDLDALDVEVGREDATVTVRAGTEEVFEGCERTLARAVADAVRAAAPEREFRRVILVSDRRHVTPETKSEFRRRIEQLESQLARGSLTESEFRANRRRLLEEFNMPTDLELGIPTKGPILPPEPKRAPAAWPQKDKARPEKPMMGEKEWVPRDAPREEPKAPKEWPDAKRPSRTMEVQKGKPEAAAWRPEPKREGPKAPKEWPDHKV